MWLLSTAELKLEYFSGPEAVPDGYAALSHVWIGEEQSFQDIQRLIARGVSLEDKRVSDKIRSACRVARENGFKWIWIDTCCIDKMSSAELSEAINSMFRWYALASICYAYLHDVSATYRRDIFGSSQWFTRGWTLQELIAPRFLLFMSSDWTPLGTKALLAEDIQGITGIDAEVLTFSRDVMAVSVARRMSWASRRRTTRPEDEAYCLMGIFGINMATLYGEGREAFRRLQEEIMKSSSDQSLFAWGETFGPEVMAHAALVRDAQEAANFLFAPSPAEFRNAADISPISPGKAVKLASACCSIPPSEARMAREMAVTSYGVRCHLVLVNVEGELYRLAVLACQDSSGHGVGLVLRLRQSSDESLPQYYVGASFSDGLPSPRSPAGVLERRKHRVHRLMTIQPDMLPILSMLNQVHAGRPGHLSRAFSASGESREMYIMHRPPHIAHPWMRLYASEPKGFFVPDWIEVAPSRYGFQCTRKHRSSGNPNEPLLLTFWHPKRNESFEIKLGRCASIPLWATVAILPASIGHRYAAYTSARHPVAGVPVKVPDGTAPPPPNPLPFSSPQFILPHQPPPPSGSLQFRTPQLDGSVYPPAAGPTKGSAAFLTPQVNMTGMTGSPQLAPSGAPCSTYHISTWKNGSYCFGDHDRTIQLTFTRWPSADSYCLEFQLRGRVYEQMLLENQRRDGTLANSGYSQNPSVNVTDASTDSSKRGLRWSLAGMQELS
ncbi:HET-domain-containing protein [Polyporus arcularius HHB13444]|uniref:HET-domain-containing protein n=1 Tax=Polyporus arcularius HHB13444 TaxID=1314778 RepID=A0A5C3NWH6_9APHY|nr:HET-domain-containing protein [Polyporus arcularius HHB13444]